jgi:tetratricopeptide (TPR) repeat protein
MSALDRRPTLWASLLLLTAVLARPAWAEDREKPGDADRLITKKLEEIRLQRGFGADGGKAAAAYAEAFRAEGVDVLALEPDEAAARIRKRAVGVELADALDEWAGLTGKEAERKRLQEVAQKADPDPLRNKVREALSKKDVAALKELAAAKEALDQSPGLLVRLARGLYGSGATAEATALLRGAQRRYPGDFWLNAELASLVVEQPGGPEDAVRFAAAAVALRPASPEAHLALAYALKARGKLDESIEETRQAIRLKPDLPGAFVVLGDALRGLRKLDEAAASYRKALEIDPPGDIRPLLGLGQIMAEKGKPDEAETLFRQAVRAQPRSVEAQRHLAGVLFRTGKADKVKEAEEVLRRLLKDEPGSAEAHLDLGVLLQQQGKLDDAVASYRESLKLKPNNAQAHFSLGLILRAQAKLDEAVAELRAALRLQPDAAPVHLALGGALRDQGRLAESLAALREALRLKPDLADAWTDLGVVLRQVGAHADAVASFRKAIELKPDSAVAHCNLGLALCDQGALKEGLAALKRGHELGSKLPGWRYPSEDWVKQAEKLLELDGKLPDVLKGTAKPADAEEALKLAALCHRQRRLYGSAAKLYAEAFVAEPKLAEDLGRAARYNAACAAALAGCGAGQDAETLDDKMRAAMRQQAQEWLKADLALWDKRLDEAKSRETARRTLQHWLADPELALVRDRAALERLPAEERKDWQKLWSEAAELLKTSNEKK